MSVSLTRINRLLPLATAAIVSCSGLLFAFSLVPEQDNSKPLNIPSVSPHAVPAHTASWPGSNPFSADGQSWILAGETTNSGKAQPGGPGKVTGIISLPGGPQGIMIDKKFVPVGAPLAGGHLTSVGDNQYVVEMDGVSQTKVLDGARKERLERLLGKH